MLLLTNLVEAEELHFVAMAIRLVDIIAIFGMVRSEVARMVVADGITTIQATFWFLYWYFISLIDPGS